MIGKCGGISAQRQGVPTMPESPADKAALADATARLPLNGITVLDLTLARAGPTAVRHFADWGANVIRIEPPAEEAEGVTGRRHGFDFQNLHRNKRAITLNLKTPEGHAAFMKLAATADVVLENMRAASLICSIVGIMDLPPMRQALLQPV